MTTYHMGFNPLEYFAAVRDPDELANRMNCKIRDWREWCFSRGIMGLWEKKLKNYYGVSFSGNTSMGVTRGGSEGELSLIKVNDLHNLIQNQLVIVTGQRPAGIAKAINSDTDSLKSARIGTAIAEYYMSQLDFEKKFVSAAEVALLCDESFVELYWDKNAGDPIAVDPETMQPEMSGDCIMRVHSSWNVTRDTGISIPYQSWNIVTYKENKYDVATAFPKFRDHILTCKNDDLPTIDFDPIPDGSDAVFCHLLIHDRTPAAPNGRYALLVGGKIVLDTDLPFKPYPIERMSPGDVIDGITGYSAANDIMGLEEITDMLHSIVTSNDAAFGGNIIVGPEGSNINHQDLAKGLRYIELAPSMVDKIRTLDLCRTPPEIFKYIEILGSKKDSFVGVNSITKGQPTGQLSGASGSAMALLQSQSISFNSGIQRSFYRCMSASMTKLIEILRTYADTPRIARIVGKSKASGLKEFKYTGQDLESISSIVYELVNPMSQTVGGKLTFAQDLIQAGMIKSPKQYLTVATTGELDEMINDDEQDNFLILEENEAMTEGRDVMAVITEMHQDHIKSHTSLISREAKENDPDLVQRVLNHVTQHLDLWAQASMSNPGLLFATGQQPLPMPMQGPPGMPPQDQGAPQGIGQEVGGGEPPVQQEADQVQQPNLPTIAGTDQTAQIPGVNI